MLARRIHEQASRTPDAPAVVDGGRTVSYRDLDRAGAAVASALSARGIRPGEAVAVRLPRSADLIAVMLGILRVGACVVPVDAQSPPERRAAMLSDAGVVLEITGDNVGALLAGEPRPLFAAGVPVAFLFFTSGTTGGPKGVEVGEAGIARLARPGWLELPAGERYACLANPAFDAISFEVWVPLLTGGCVVVLDEAAVRDPDALGAALRRHDVGTMFLTTALFNTLAVTAPHCLGTVRRVLFGGEATNTALVRGWLRDNPRGALYNVYGPTESTTFALWHPVPRDFAGDVVPLGRPVPGTATRLDDAGELWLAGDGLAAGYRGRPAETAERFVWRDGVRWYRTGDLARLDEHGDLVFGGRADRQVKIRGFRVEPGEVEQGLTSCAGVREAYVTARRPAPDRPHELLAYVVADPALDAAGYQRHLTTVLPGYMHPHHTWRVDRLPLTANGKVDAAALLSRDEPPWRVRSDPDEATGRLRELLDVAAEIVGVADLRPGDRWTDVGGDSLSALRLRHEVRRRWGLDLPVARILDGDLGELAAATGSGEYPALDGRISGLATSEQQRLWLIDRRGSAPLAYHVPLVFRVDGPVDVDRLRQALREVVARHVALRTGFVAAPDGLRQVVGEPYDPWWPGPDEPFDLAEPRMLRAVWRDGELRLRLHHIAVDGWSLNVLFRDLSAAYAGRPLTEPVHTPLEHAAWQQEWFGSPAYAERSAGLRAILSGDAEPLPPNRDSTGAGLFVSTVDVTRRAALDRLAAELRVTPFPLLLAAFAVSLYAVTGVTAARVAAPAANRPLPEFAGGVGMFANTVPLPVTVDPRQELRFQLPGIAAAARRVLDRQDVAFADVETPFDALFVLENTDFSALTLPGCEVSPRWVAPAAVKCPITLSVVERPDGYDCLWEYAESHVDAGQVAALAEAFTGAMDMMLGSGTPAGLAREVRRGMPDHGRGPAPVAGIRSIAESFAAQVARTPDAVAVAGAATYAELDRYAATLAAELAGPGAGRVALFLPPSVEHVVALLALARLNLTAVPLDPAYPPELLRRVLAQARPRCVLLPPDGDPAFDAVDVELPRHPVRLRAGDDVVPPVAPHRPLYTLFTSGSTGEPKGVQVGDATLANLLAWQDGPGGLGGPAVTQQFAMLSFDVSFQEIFTTLCGGGTLHLIQPGWRQDVPALLGRLRDAGIERIFLPYVALQLLAEHGVHLGIHPPRLRDVVTAGEQLVVTDTIRRWFAGLPGARLHNHYGPTETHVVSALTLDGDPAGWPERPAIGRPVAGALLRVADAAGLPVPPGFPGELLLGGVMATRCYLGDPREERFVELHGTGLCYRSGDQARFDADGLLHFLGRDDQQIKISGHRLELGQVEAALLRHPAVVQAVVTRDAGRLVACLQMRASREVDAAGLAAHLAGLLPPYARVDRFRVLPELPRTASGKLDRRAALRAPGHDLAPASPAPVAPAGLAGELAAAFTAVTGRVAGPGRTFFAAGASSLDLMRFHLRCTTELGLRFTVADLFEHVTIDALAGFLSDPAAGLAADPTPVDERSAAGTAPVDERPAAGEPIAVVGMAVRLPGAPDLASFWELIRGGGSGIEEFPAADGLVGARCQMDGLLAFDPEHFGISRRDARLMDPQQRHLLMSCVEALAHAGIARPGATRAGLVAGCGENTYFQAMLRDGDPEQLPDEFQLAQHHDKDFLATKAAYHLGLTGPAFTVQSACSTSLVAVHLAAALLRTGEADVMLAGGVLVDASLTDGYRYRPQHIFSPDGWCRPFSHDAGGTVGGSGSAVVVLKPLSRARADGDTVYAVITGSAVNNDGGDKMSYSAPSVAGQRAVIQEALRRAGRTGADIGYVEAHGTGTRLGDPVEVGALRQAYGIGDPASVALSSVKSQIGHLGAAAGAAGLVRAVLSLHHGLIPPTPTFHALNPAIDPGPFHVPAHATPWPPGRPRTAAVSSFGIGGTNAHLVLEAAPQPAAVALEPGAELVLRASSPEALRLDAERIAGYLGTHPGELPRVLRHLRSGRAGGDWAITGECADTATAVALLQTTPPRAAKAVAVLRTSQPHGAKAEPEDVAARPAPPPWDFPPPAFALAEYDFPRKPAASGPATAVAGPARLPEDEWLHQPLWVRLRRAADRPAGRVDRVAVLATTGPADPSLLRALTQAYTQVLPVHDADPRAVLDTVGDQDVDWIHALPLDTADAAHACLDTPAALLRASVGRSVRAVWLSWGAAPIDGPVTQPALALLTGVVAVAEQEGYRPGHWIDLPGPDAGDWAGPLAALLSGPGLTDLPNRIGLRDGFWWHRVTAPVASPTPAAPPPGVHLILGGTGGLGTAIADWLLTEPGAEVLLLSRRPQLPPALAAHAARVRLIDADLTADPAELVATVARHTSTLSSIVHAAGTASGALIAHRDPAAARAATAAKLRGARLAELLAIRFHPGLVLYCSSMAGQHGGVGQLDYAAAAGVLDAYAHLPGPATRITVDWDVWREVGMATRTLRTGSRHEAHLATGLTVAEGRRVLADALGLGLPQVLVSTTDIAASRWFYAAPAGLPPLPSVITDPAELVTSHLRERLGVDQLDADAPLYDLGADSLTLIDLIAVIKESLGVDLDLAHLSHRVSVAEIIEHLGGAGEPELLEVWQYGDGTDVLCLIHPVGGDIQAYRSLVAAVGPGLTVCLIADPGLRGREPGWSLAERARVYREALAAAYPPERWRHRLAGWSFGAWVAAAMAAEAERSGRPAAALHLIDPPPPRSGPQFLGYDEETLRTLFAAELRSTGGHGTEYADRLARCCRANLAAMASYQPPRLTATPSRLWLAEHGDPAAWREHLPSPSAVVVLGTDHYGIVRPPWAEQIGRSIG
ncbi:SDR family NAD(P)-dependent oxidoreductase [Dactylosporangium sp. CA-092794]|uniref:SDR family NAD(P)-dependent oxidoreductase n=1 Tax=Dactylosporangium sp. CA-092794 TaxID=3239929 RepID=UPI003D9157C7